MFFAQNFLMNHIFRKFLFFSFIILILGLGGTLIKTGGSSMFASLFQGGSSLPGDSVEFYIPNDYVADPGSVGMISIKAAKNFEGIAGFGMDVLFNEEHLSAQGISIIGTPLENAGFYVEKNLSVPGKISIVGASAGSGISLKQGDELLRIEFKISEFAPISSSFSLQLQNAMLATSSLQELHPVLGNGKISIASSGNLKILDISAPSPKEITIKMNAEISSADISDIVITPDIKNSLTKLEINGDKIRIYGLSDMTPMLEYILRMGSSVQGNAVGGFVPGENMAVFTGPPTVSGRGSFSISNISALSDTSLLVSFTKELNAKSLETAHFSVLGNLVYLDEHPPTLQQDKKSIIIVLRPSTPLSSLSETPYLIIRRLNPEIDLRSADGELLSLNVFPIPLFIPRVQNVPVLQSVRLENGTTVVATFEKNILGSSVSLNSFTLKEIDDEGREVSGNILDQENIQFFISSDFRDISFSPVETQAEKIYRFEILPNTIADFESGFNIGNFSRSGVFLGRGSADFESSFGITSLEVLSSTRLAVGFSKEPSDDSVRALNFNIFSFDETGSRKKLLVQSVQKEGSVVFLETAEQLSGETYFLLARADKWKTLSGNALGGKNEMIFSGFVPSFPKILRVEPAFINSKESVDIHIFGEHFLEGTTVRLHDQVLAIREKTDNSLSAIVPAGFKSGIYTLRLTAPSGDFAELKDALVVSEEQKLIQVLSSENYASPRRIPNDNTTKTKLWVRIEDPKGVSDIDSVVADLRPLDGSAAEKFTPGEIVDNKRWYFLEVTVPETVSTSENPYVLEITAQNKGGDKAKGTVSLTVSRDTKGSIPPVIRNAFADPKDIVTNDAENPVRFFVEVSDEDGASDLDQVVLELAQIGHGTIVLQPKNTLSEGSGSKTAFFQSAEGYTIPGRVPDGTYELPLTVIDKTGEEVRSAISVRVGKVSSTGPQIDDENFYISPSRDLVADGRTEYRLHVKVSDPGGADDIEAVTANLVDLGIEPIALTPGEREGRSRWYSSAALILPSSVIPGYRKIEVTATDKAGNYDTYDIKVEVSLTNKEGFAPEVKSERGYTTPAVLPADESTKFSAYIFVEDRDRDLSHVIIQLGNQALYTSDSLPEDTDISDADGKKQCVSTRSILCMQPILREGDGQWFHLSNLVVKRDIQESMNEFQLPIVAVDKTGKTAKGYLSLQVGSGTLTGLQTKPVVKSALGTATDRVQVLFSGPVDPKLIKKEAFKIVESTSIADTLPLLSLFVSVDGRVVTLDTNRQEPGKAYSVIVNADALGLENLRQNENIVSFSGFDPEERKSPLKITKAEALSSELIQVSFSDVISFTSLVGPKNVSVYWQGSGEKKYLPVYELSVGDRENILLVKTRAQKSGAQYTIEFENTIESPYATPAKRNLTSQFTGFAFSASESVQSLFVRADFNNDGAVDFRDFTLFSAVYGKSGNAEGGDFNQDGKVDFLDFTLFSSNYGANQASNTAPSLGSSFVPVTSSSSSESLFQQNSAVVSPSGYYGSTPSVSPTLFVTPSSDIFHYAAPNTPDPTIVFTPSPSSSLVPTYTPVYTPTPSFDATPSSSPSVDTVTVPNELLLLEETPIDDPLLMLFGQ